jgi:hypothetical protein
MSAEEKKVTKTTYELSAGGIAMLKDFLPLTEWYKEDPKAAWLIVRSVEAEEALPDIGERPKQTDAIPEINKWAERSFQFEWTEKQLNAAKSCITFFKKHGRLFAHKHTVAVMRLLGMLNPADE